MYSFMRSSCSPRLSASVSMTTRLNRPVTSVITRVLPGAAAAETSFSRAASLPACPGLATKTSRIMIIVSPVWSMVGTASAAVLLAIVLYRRHAHYAAHLEQPGPGARSDGLGQRPAADCLPVAAGHGELRQPFLVGQISSRNQRLPLIAAVRNDGRNGVFHPIDDPMRPQIVQQQNLGVQSRPVGLPVGGVRG